jgi:hypothetical protein
MKKTILLAATIILTSCVQHDTIVIDGCEYIETTTSSSGGIRSTMVHKGNCKNPIHNPEKIVISNDEQKYRDILKLPDDSVFISQP